MSFKFKQGDKVKIIGANQFGNDSNIGKLTIIYKVMPEHFFSTESPSSAPAYQVECDSIWYHGDSLELANTSESTNHSVPTKILAGTHRILTLEEFYEKYGKDRVDGCNLAKPYINNSMKDYFGRTIDRDCVVVKRDDLNKIDWKCYFWDLNWIKPIEVQQECVKEDSRVTAYLTTADIRVTPTTDTVIYPFKPIKKKTVEVQPEFDLTVKRRKRKPMDF